MTPPKPIDLSPNGARSPANRTGRGRRAATEGPNGEMRSDRFAKNCADRRRQAHGERAPESDPDRCLDEPRATGSCADRAEERQEQ